MKTQKWWQEAIIYQVYLRSFKDGNNDGIGDFKGLIAKLDYFSLLGVNALWISPHYDSPMDDNGYDIRNFYKVSEDYGTIDDVKLFIKEAHQRGIKVLFDLVLNHTSDEHPWFQAAKNPHHQDFQKYHDYYIWQPPIYNNQGTKIPPTNWQGWFGDNTWEYNDFTNEYYLHIFSKKMPDLNWRNKDMRNDLKAMTKWWIDLGVDGFRVDASNHLEKNWDFPDTFPGHEHFSSLPKHHEYLQEFGRDIFIPNQVMTIGEAGGASKEEALRYCGFTSEEFDMLIHFGHCWADIDDHNHLTPGKWSKGPLQTSKIKESFNKWYKMLQGEGWNIIYWHNHDQPRVISHYGNDKKYHQLSGKMLCYTMYFMPGTPIVYQGEEIGMTNVDYQDLSDFRDVEVFTKYADFIAKGISHETAMQIFRDRSRDNARSPFQWDDKENASFSEAISWIKVNNNYTSINLAQQISDSKSIFSTYQDVFALRKELCVGNGIITFYDLESNNSFIYENKLANKTLLIVANFTDRDIMINLDMDIDNYFPFRCNYNSKQIAKDMYLRPFETIVYIK